VARISSWPSRSALVALGLTAGIVACGDKDFPETVVVPVNNAFTQTNLVADVAGAGARTIDTNLVNPWGLVFGANGALWVANNGTGTSTAYDASGNILPIVVHIADAAGTGKGAPTGMVANPTTDFAIPGVGGSAFIWAGENGTISAWNSSSNDSAHVIVNRPNSVYKGIAMATNAGANFIYLTDFKNNNVDVFDGTFTLIRSFTDATIPAGYAPFGIANLNGLLYVTFAKQKAPDNVDDDPGVGNGFVDVFTQDGQLVKRFASNGRLNSPWAVVAAPSPFGQFNNVILVGNFGDGQIGAYDATSGALIDVMRAPGGSPIAIPGLWGLAFGPSAGSTTLYFAAGAANETHGLVGTLTPAP